MKKVFLLTAWLSVYATVQAQRQVQVEYINYGDLIGVITDFVKVADTILWKQSMNSLRTSASSLKEDIPVQIPGVSMAPQKKELKDEQIFSKRKSSVTVVGRLRRVSGTNINLEVMGTGFFISKEGYCITNRHVLQDLLQKKADDNDLVYFVITEDKKVYPLEKLLCYSLNNDLAIFSLISNGRYFTPIPLGKPAIVGAPVYCISHPAGELYCFSKGMVTRNVSRDITTLGTAFSSAGKTPIRMEISADYGGGSSGGPVIDRCGNLVGIIATTNTIFLHEQTGGAATAQPQMVIKSTIPVKALTDLLK